MPEATPFISLKVEARDLDALGEKLKDIVPLACQSAYNEIVSQYNADGISVQGTVTPNGLMLQFNLKVPEEKLRLRKMPPNTPIKTTYGRYVCKVHLYSGGTIVAEYMVPYEVEFSLIRKLFISRITEILIRSFDAAIMWGIL